MCSRMKYMRPSMRTDWANTSRKEKILEVMMIGGHRDRKILLWFPWLFFFFPSYFSSLCNLVGYDRLKRFLNTKTIHPSVKALILIPFLRFLAMCYLLPLGLPSWVLASRADSSASLFSTSWPLILCHSSSLYLVPCLLPTPVFLKTCIIGLIAHSFANKSLSHFLSDRGCQLILSWPNSLFNFLRSLLHLRHSV